MHLPPLGDPIEEAKRVIGEAEQRKITLRLFGGVSFYLRCPSARHPDLKRSYVDIDFMGHAKQSVGIRRLFGDLGYAPRHIFNAVQGYKRLIFNDLEHQRRVDIFLDVFEMCHKFNFTNRLEIDEYTLSLADMLATKLQIVELNEKDLKDALCMLVDYDVGKEDSGAINGAYLAKLCADEWGTYRTFTMNLQKLSGMLDDREIGVTHRKLAKTRIEKLRDMIEATPKSLGWKLRARVGDKMPWYELPEADREVVDSRAPGAPSEMVR